MVATFFAFLNDSVNAPAARRLYGLVGLGGVSGGVFGSSVVSANVTLLSFSTWLWLCSGLTVLIILLAWAAGRLVTREAVTASAEHTPVPPQGNAATEGARLVFSSRYLLSIVAIVGLYEVISTIIDFQFTFTVSHYLDGPEIGRHFALVYSITNWVSLLVQLFLTGFIMTRFGLAAALLVLPFTIALGSSAFVIFPALWVGSMLSTADNGFSYSINQSAKEALYVPTTAAEKYRAKAFIDMFVQRFAKAVAVVTQPGHHLRGQGYFQSALPGPADPGSADSVGNRGTLCGQAVQRTWKTPRTAGMQEQPPYLVPHSQEEIVILYEDGDLLLVRKPDLLLSIPGRHPLNKDCLITRLQQTYPTASIVHRLDLDTSGIMVIPLNKANPRPYQPPVPAAAGGEVLPRDRVRRGGPG